MKAGVMKLLRAGMVPARTWGVHAVGISSNSKIQFEETDGSSGGQRNTSSLSLFVEASGLEVEEDLSTLATQYWAEGVWTGKWYQERREAWMKQV